MASKAQSIRVGMFAAATLVLGAVVLIVFGGLRFWEVSDRCRIVFATSVYGLHPGAQVFLNGIKVGTVERLGLVPDDIRQVAVTIKLDSGTPVRSDTQAMLQYAGITGLKVIDLRGGTSGAAVLPPGGQIAAGEGLLDKLEASRPRRPRRRAVDRDVAHRSTDDSRRRQRERAAGPRARRPPGDHRACPALSAMRFT